MPLHKVSHVKRSMIQAFNRKTIFGLGFAVVGVAILLLTSAASLTASLEPELIPAARIGAAGIIDQTASAGGAVQFVGKILHPEDFGAAGNGTTDDTAAIQQAFNAVKAGETVQFSAGKTYRHTNVVTISVNGTHITGPGTLLATNESLSAFRIDADSVLVDGGLLLKMQSTTRRWDAYEQMKLRLSGHTGVVLRNITIDGGAAAGVFIEGSTNYLVEDVTVKNTRADGIHNTGGANNGIIRRPIVSNVGDDGVAVVSYGDGTPCNHIQIISPRLYGNNWGRGFTVVGGEDITFSDIYAEGTNAAGIYVASEGEPYFTYSARRIKYSGGELKNSNTNASIDHGAVLVYNARPGYFIEDVTIENIKITDTSMTASRQVGLLNFGGGIDRINLKNFTITNGPGTLFYAASVPGTNYNTTSWTYNGVAQTDHLGW